MVAGTGKTILAVDDDPDVLRLVEAMLRHFGFRVFIAGGAEEALDVFGKMDSAPDLLLTDVVMPGVSGPALADRLLAAEPDLRVLFMSGYDNRQIVQHYVVKPGFPLLPKPFTVERLTEKVNSILAAPRTSLIDRPAI